MEKILGASLLLSAMLLSLVEFSKGMPMEPNFNRNRAAPAGNRIPRNQPGENVIPEYLAPDIENQLQLPILPPILDPSIYYYRDEYGVHPLRSGEYTVGVYDNFIHGIVIHDRFRKVLGTRKRPVAVGVSSRIPLYGESPANVRFGETPEHTYGMTWRKVIISAEHRDPCTIL